MHMLLEAGADARAMDINGCAPIQYLLKVTDVRPMAIPELCYQLLLNYKAARIYPPQFHKVQSLAVSVDLCCYPKTLFALHFNDGLFFAGFAVMP